jgi:perosamine synthetase
VVKRLIPLFKPFMPNELPELENILQSGNLAYGKWGKTFESQLANYVGNDLILTTNSFNSAMLVALTTLGIKAGDEVIASAMSCLASNQPFATQGIKVAWADIDPHTGTLDPQSVRSIITPKTKAIFHNHFCGYVGYVDEINAIGKEYGLFVVDDAIEAFGSDYKGHKLGSTGTDVTAYSFQAVRLPNTIDGGGLSFGSSELYEKALKVRDYGIDRSSFRDKSGEISPSCDITLPGYGATLSEVNSYIGAVQMVHIDELFRAQRNNAKFWTAEFEGTSESGSALPPQENTTPNYWVYGVLSQDKPKAIEKFRKAGSYASGVHLNNNNYSVFGPHIHLPGVDEFAAKFYALPCGWWQKKGSER